jgi:hypothetical protein
VSFQVVICHESTYEPHVGQNNSNLIPLVTGTKEAHGTAEL